MKKVLSLILALLLIPAAFLPARAENGGKADLVYLWDRSGETPVRIGSAVPLAEGIVVMPAAVLPEAVQQLTVSDGAHDWTVRAAIPDSEGLIASVFFDAGEVPADFAFWQLMPYGESVPADACVVRTAEENGSRKEISVLSSEEMIRQGRRCLLLTLTEPASPGSAVLTADGQLAAVVIAEWAEGNNRALAVPADEIAGSLAGTSQLLANLQSWGSAPEGLNVTLKKNRATIEWKQMILPETAEGETLYLVVADTANNYLNYFPAEMKNRTVTLLLTPGRFYIAGMLKTKTTPSDYPVSYVSFFVPRAKRLTDYRFEPVVTAVAESSGEGKAPVPVTEVTEELLRSGRAYFYSHSAYQVVTTISDVTLLITLTDPKGNNYRYESSWIYSPDYMKEDIWYLLLKDTGLLSMLDVNGYPPGLYRLAYYLNGDLADSLEFTLK